MSRLRYGVPLWLAPGPSRPSTFPALQNHSRADVIVIGGGLTGAVLALEFASQGFDIALLEAGAVGHGSTAANSALLMQEPDEDFGRLQRTYGRAAARRIWELSRTATSRFIHTIEDRRIACGLVRRDSVYYTTSADSAVRLTKEHRRRRVEGFGGRWLDPEALKRETGISGQGAIRTRGDAQLNPYLACLGLLRAAKSEGARIFEHSRVRKIERSRGSVRAVTDSGSVEAPRVVVATGYATPDFRPLAARFKMKHTYVVATAPIPAHTRRALGLGEVMIWDTERPYHYARWTADHRLLFGGGDRPRVPDRLRRRALAEAVDGLRAYFYGLFPALAGIPIDLAWEGLFAMTPDGLPYIGAHRRYPSHLFALGYGGNGMTFAFIAAKLLLEQLRGVHSRDQDLFAFSRASGGRLR